jgi:hypothetical protein
VGISASSVAKPPKVVIAHLDGRRTQGYVFDFSPLRDSCKLFPSQTAQAGQGETVEVKSLKAIFFLRDAGVEPPPVVSAATGKPVILLGPATPPAPPAAVKPPAGPQRRRLEVIFQDKERLEGTTEGYSRDRLGFFMVPEDPTGKILRVFVINRNVKEVKWIPAASAEPKPAPAPSS